VQPASRVGGGDLLQEAEELLMACGSVQASVTLPVEASSAANSVVVPCRT
jgi:hypothetical protein